ncbi:hypothetical protein AAG570_007132 [Ranatra chinensis]|uniref:Gamma-glutamylcysteine synthetase regulatory subunit n=1 Tax=Ranatra chinensis TaxID=642074 RepID=A0ABD0XV14_9HEMI
MFHQNNKKHETTEISMSSSYFICVVLKNLSVILFGRISTELKKSSLSHIAVKPSIVQINLASCCVVPPQLQEFAKQHEVQLLTHNDPKELLPPGALGEVCSVGRVRLDWAARFQSHVKCRGVLATKGYLVCLRMES